MSDSYQAVYDAVRSRISNGNIGDAIRDVALQTFDFGHVRALAQEQIGIVGYEMARPSVLFRPELTQDGNAWLAIYGDLPTGCVGVGDTPAAAMADFDKVWYRPAVVAPSLPLHEGSGE
jgi:hypothetical protein